MKNRILLMFLALSAIVTAEGIQTVGVAGNYSTSIYKGKNQIRPLPLVNLNYNRFFIKGLKPGFTLYEEPQFKVNALIDPLAGYFDGWTIKGSDMDNGYDELDTRKSQFMYGLDVDFEFSEEVIGNINYLFGSKGSKGELSLTYIIPVNERLVILPSAGVKYYQSKWVDYYTGVSSEEVSKNTKIDKTYKGKDSFSASASLTVEYAVTEQLSANTFVGVEYFGDKISDSPIVKDNHRVYGGIGVRYSF